MRREIEDIISLILRWGVTISIIVIAAGLLVLLVTGQTGVGPLVFEGKLYPRLGPGPTGPRDVLAQLIPPRPYGLIALGLLLLILTPIIRVATSLAVFARDRDRAYILITSLVFVVLLVSLLLGAGA